MLRLILNALGGPRPEGLTPAEELAIVHEVERRMKNLPAETYRMIEEMVDSRVAREEKFYRYLFIIASLAVAVLLAVFFNITASNATQKVTEMLDKSEAAQKLEGINKMHQEALQSLQSLNVTGNEMTNRAAQLTARVKELESIDNIVRYAADGTLHLKPSDGAIWLSRKDGTGLKGYFIFYGLDDGTENPVGFQVGPYPSGTARP